MPRQSVKTTGENPAVKTHKIKIVFSHEMSKTKTLERWINEFVKNKDIISIVPFPSSTIAVMIHYKE